MAFHCQGPNPGESWGEFTCRSGPAWSDWGGQRESPSCNSALEILCCPCDPLPVQHRWGCLVVMDDFTVLLFSFDNPADFLPSEVWEPPAQWVTAFPWTQKGKLMVCSAEWLFLGENSWTWTCYYFLGGYKGREISHRSGGKIQTSKIFKARLPWAATGAGSVLCVVPNTAVKQSTRLEMHKNDQLQLHLFSFPWRNKWIIQIWKS